MGQHLRQRQTAYVHSNSCCSSTVSIYSAIHCRHCGIRKRLKNPRHDSGRNARKPKNRHEINVGLWHMQHIAAVAAMAKILLQTLTTYAKREPTFPKNQNIGEFFPLNSWKIKPQFFRKRGKYVPTTSLVFLTYQLSTCSLKINHIF